MKWKKLWWISPDEIFQSGEYQYMAVPFAEVIKEDTVRIYFTPRDRANRSHIFYLETDINRRTVGRIVGPIIEPGARGCFDDSGVMMSWITQNEKEKYLYYIGWNLGKTVPFRNSIGLAVSNDGDHFNKLFDGPIMDRSMNEPQFCASSCVLKEDIWKMWYLSCVKWEKCNDEIRHYYHIKYAESNDGINWKREGVVCIDFKDKDEYAISRPCVIKEREIYKMWYSYRGKAYRIGYAESDDGVSWIRKDEEAGIDITCNGPDSDMICYPFVFDYHNERYMLYNGNEYGKTGMGLAKLVRN